MSIHVSLVQADGTPSAVALLPDRVIISPQGPVALLAPDIAIAKVPPGRPRKIGVVIASIIRSSDDFPQLIINRLPPMLKHISTFVPSLKLVRIAPDSRTLKLVLAVAVLAMRKPPNRTCRLLNVIVDPILVWKVGLKPFWPKVT